MEFLISDTMLKNILTGKEIYTVDKTKQKDIIVCSGVFMVSIIVGIIFILAMVFMALSPTTLGFGLGWGADILVFLRGGVPVLLVLLGIISVFIGIADIKDKQDAKKEEEAMRLEEENKK